MAKRTITGVVTSAAGNKTIVVTRTSRETHSLYGKKFTRSQKFHAHDEKNEVKLGDTVIIEESRPISRTKTWTLVKVAERGREKFELKKTAVEEEAETKLAEKEAKKAEEKAAETEKETAK
jgi:small subunit ribosomal protein S17